MGDTLRPPEPAYELPKCEACGKQGMNCVARIANDIHWYLCPDTCLQGLLAEVNGWLRREQRHNQLLAGAAQEDAEDDERELATLAELGVRD